MTILDAFEKFLADVVNLNQTRLNLLDQRVISIVNALKNDSTVGPKYLGHIPQGSWPHQTIIRPVGENDEFDADFLLHLEEETEWSKEPKTYLKELRAAFKRTTYKDMIRKKNRCVRVGYAGDCHIDVVPYLVLADGRQVIINYAENCFEDTNPQGFTDWMKEKDDLASGNLRRVIRLLKYLRDFKNTFSCPSVILTTLVGGQVQAFDTSNKYSDIPRAFVSLLEDLNAWLSLYYTMPPIVDPSCPGTYFNHRWDEAQYQNFKEMIARYAGWARAAIDEDDDTKAVVLWQKLFGPSLELPVESKSEAASARPVDITRAAPGEMFIEDKGFQLSRGYKARIDATVDKKPGFRSGSLRSLRKVQKGRQLRFKLVTDTPPPFDVYWKVRNSGEEAERANGLRGELTKDGGTLSRTESTRYRGRHYVAAYVVKDSRIVASDRHDVVIE